MASPQRASTRIGSMSRDSWDPILMEELVGENEQMLMEIEALRKEVDTLKNESKRATEEAESRVAKVMAADDTALAKLRDDITDFLRETKCLTLGEAKRKLVDDFEPLRVSAAQSKMEHDLMVKQVEELELAIVESEQEVDRRACEQEEVEKHLQQLRTIRSSVYAARFDVVAERAEREGNSQPRSLQQAMSSSMAELERHRAMLESMASTPAAQRDGTLQFGCSCLSQIVDLSKIINGYISERLPPDDQAVMKR